MQKEIGVFDLKVSAEKFYPVKQLSIYEVDDSEVPESIKNGQGVSLIVPVGKNEDMVVLNPLYTGGKLEPKIMKLKLPAIKYEPGDVIAKLVVLK